MGRGRGREKKKERKREMIREMTRGMIRGREREMIRERGKREKEGEMIALRTGEMSCNLNYKNMQGKNMP